MAFVRAFVITLLVLAVFGAAVFRLHGPAPAEESTSAPAAGGGNATGNETAGNATTNATNQTAAMPANETPAMAPTNETYATNSTNSTGATNATAPTNATG